MKQILLLLSGMFLLIASIAQPPVKLKKKDRKRDILIETNMGNMVLRLSDSTPLHRDNFIRLVKAHTYDSLLFHRVIHHFMIQGGDIQSRNAAADKALGEGDLGYTVPAEFRPGLFHKKGMLAAAREGDDVNPARASSASQFYIVQGKVYTDAGVDSVEQRRLHRSIPVDQRKVYKSIGGTPFLDGTYTIFGELLNGYDVLDSIAATPTNATTDRPLKDVIIIRAKLIKRKQYDAGK